MTLVLNNDSVQSVLTIYTAAFYRHLWFFVKNIDLPKPPGHIQILLSTLPTMVSAKSKQAIFPNTMRRIPWII